MKTEQNHGDNRKKIANTQETRWQKNMISPSRLFFILLLSVFITELLIMILLFHTSFVSAEKEILLDAVLLTTVLSPILFFLFFRPLQNVIIKYKFSENELYRLKEHLEQEVEARTLDLESIVQKLREEIAEKTQLKVDHEIIHCALHNTLTSMNEAFVSLDRHWRYTYVNKAAEIILGQNTEELLGKVCWDQFPESFYSLAYKEIHRSVEENCAVSFENYVPEPRNRWYENRCYPSPSGVSIFFTDITERKNTEQKFRDLNDHFETTREQERLALSREIHDEIGQSLTALKFDISWIEHKFLPVSSDLIGRMNAMRSTLDTLIAKTQNISAELRPPLLDSLGLSAAIDWQTREFKRRCGIECNLMLNEGVKVPDKNLGTVIMRILQEALTNIARHSGATEVNISLCKGHSDNIVLEISDNGCGVSRDKIDSPLSFGLMGMHERARLCYGNLTIKGTQGDGTTIRLEIPHRVEEEGH